MKRNIPTILVIVVIFSLILVYTITSTYAVIINVKDENGVKEIVNVITLKDLVTNDDGSFNTTYYDVKNELSITDSEAELIMESEKLNENLQIVLNSIVDYKLNNGTKLTNDYIYNLILDGVNNTYTLTEELKNKVIDKASLYKEDISNYLYDIEVEEIR